VCSFHLDSFTKNQPTQIRQANSMLAGMESLVQETIDAELIVDVCASFSVASANILASSVVCS
jgi:hypothetical protein